MHLAVEVLRQPRLLNDILGILAQRLHSGDDVVAAQQGGVGEWGRPNAIIYGRIYRPNSIFYMKYLSFRTFGMLCLRQSPLTRYRTGCSDASTVANEG